VKAYLASSFDLAYRVEEISKFLNENDIDITVRWWNRDFKELDLPLQVWYKHNLIKRVKERNFKGIDECDFLVLVCPEDKPKKFNGGNIEVGYAFGKGKQVFSIGKIDKSGMYFDVIRCKDKKELLKKISKWRSENKR